MAGEGFSKWFYCYLLCMAIGTSISVYLQKNIVVIKYRMRTMTNVNKDKDKSEDVDKDAGSIL